MEKLYAYNTYRSDCNRQLLTECKTHYRKYLHNVKSVFLRCQGYQMEDLRYNSSSELYIFKSIKQKQNCILGVKNVLNTLKI